jgi:hypothetical protein
VRVVSRQPIWREGQKVKKFVVAGALAFGLLVASPGSAGASVVHCSWDPVVPIVTPGGHIVLVYDSVWTSSALDLAVPLATYTTKRVHGSDGEQATQVDMAIWTPTGLLLRYSTMDEVTTGLLGNGKVLARAYGTSGKTVHLKFTLQES